MVKKALAILLSMIMVFGLVACSVENGTSAGKNDTGLSKQNNEVIKYAKSVKQNDIVVWSVQPTEKILADHVYDDDYMANRSMEIWAYQNDYEAGQIIVTPKMSDIDYYDIEINDLFSTDGTILSKENFTVYNQKYYEIDESTRNTTTELGWYPDAILPFEVAKAYGENTVKAGDNQGLWFTLKTSTTQKAGVYTGAFTVTCDGVDYQVPVSVTVWDTAVSEETHTRVICGLQPYWTLEAKYWSAMANGEKDFSNEMVDKYLDVLLDHRISTFTNNASLYNEDEYAAELFRRALDPRSTTVVIGGQSTWEWIAEYNGTEVGVNWDSYKKVMNALANECINYYNETGIKVNAFDKCVTYFLQTDESLLHNNTHRPNFIFSQVVSVCAELSDQWLNGGLNCDDQAFVQELTDSMCDIEQIYVDRFYESSKVRGVVTWCPTIERYNTAYERSLYAHDNPAERWWYTCNNPLTPYPTLHTDDPQQMLSSRIMGWMQFDYDVIGNLYWSSTYYLKSVGGNSGILNELEDYYAGGRRESGANGDGYLFFPGASYGIDGPVSTIRLESWRDGLEEYEIMYAYEQQAKRVDENANVRNVLQYLYEKLYTGTKVVTNSDLFLEARKALAQFAVAASKGVVVSDVRIENSKPVFTVYAPVGVELKLGETVLEGTAVGEMIRYEVKTVVEGEDNILKFAAGDISINVNLDGDVVENSASVVVGNNTELVRATGEFVDATAEMGVTGQVYKVTATGDNAYILLSSDFVQSLDSDTLWVKLQVYSESVSSLSLWTSFENRKAYTKSFDMKLSEGVNELLVQVSTMDFDTLGRLKTIKIDIEPGSTIYITKGVERK